jgi:lysophospholipase L1-like esterase
LPASTYAGWFKANTPQIALMHFGGADLLANMPVDGVMMAYTTLLGELRKANPSAILLIAQHTPEGKDAVLTLNADIAKWATENTTAQSPVIAVDLYTGILPSDQSDGVHLNLSGSQKVADRFFAALKPFFKP